MHGQADDLEMGVCGGNWTLKAASKALFATVVVVRSAVDTEASCVWNSITYRCRMEEEGE